MQLFRAMPWNEGRHGLEEVSSSKLDVGLSLKAICELEDIQPTTSMAARQAIDWPTSINDGQILLEL